MCRVGASGRWGIVAVGEGTAGIDVLVEPNQFASRAPGLHKPVATLGSKIEGKDEALWRFTEALIETASAMKADPECWLEAAAAARSDLSRDSLAMASRMVSTRQCIDGYLDPGALEGSMAYVYANPDFVRVPQVGIGDMVDLRFTTRALEAMSVAGGTGLDAWEWGGSGAPAQPRLSLPMVPTCGL